jgi:hypothetical protein
LLIRETASAKLHHNYIAALAIWLRDVKKIQACLRRNRTTTSMRAIS